MGATMTSQGDSFTADQVRFAYEAASARVCDLDLSDIREILCGLHDAGIDVRFPDRPLYWVHENYRGHWFVIRGDGTSEGSHVAAFDSTHPSPRAAATAEARKLNAESVRGK